MATFFRLHADSVCIVGSYAMVGLSNLEGNLWNGGLQAVNISTGDIEASESLATGVCVVRSIDNGHFVCGRDDGNISVHDMGLHTVSLLEVHEDCVSSIASNSSNLGCFASTGWDSSVLFWDLNANNKKPVVHIDNAHYGHINDVCYSMTDSNIVCTGGQDGFVRVWDSREDPKSGCVSIFDCGKIVSSVLYGEANRNLLLVGGDDGSMNWYDIRSSAFDIGSKKVHKGRVRCVRSACDIGYVSGSDDATIVYFKMNESNQGSEIEILSR